MLKMSVVIPVYNVESYLENMINSILIQDFDNYELLLIDDGSTDRSGLICNEIANKDYRVRVFHITNGGVSNARNFGLAKATGEYIYFADSDDFLESGMFNHFATIRFNRILLCVGVYKLMRKETPALWLHPMQSYI